VKSRHLIIAAVALGIAAALVLLLVTTGGDPDPEAEAPPERDDDTRSTELTPPSLDPPTTGAPPPAPDLAQVELVGATVEIDADLGHGAFAGTVVNWGNSTPVPGAELTFLHQGSTVSVRSDPTGRFVFRPEAAGRYRLAVATADGFLPYAPELGRSPIELVARAHKRVSGILVYLTPAIEYTGVVVNKRGEPVAGATITRAGAQLDSAMIPLDSTFRSGADGTFTFHAFDDTVFEARHPVAGFGRGVLGGPEQISRRMEIKLVAGARPPSGAIAGEVVDESGRPIGSAVVRASPATGDDPVPPVEVETGADGRFELRGLDDRLYAVSAAAEGRATGTARAKPGAPALTIRLADGAIIRGEVVDAGGAPVPSFTVVARRVTGALDRGPGQLASVFDGDGAFEIEGLEAGEYAVVASAAGHAPSGEVKTEAVDPADARPISIRLPRGGTLAGQVIDAKSRAPLENARVSTESRMGIGAAATPAIASAVTGADGRFRLPGLTPGKTSVNVAAFAHHAEIVTGIDIPAAGVAGPITVELEPAADGEKPRTEFAGIGCAIGAASDGFRVSRVFPGSGCEEAGLAVDDVIVAVEGVAVVDLGFEPALQRLRGPEGTQVMISLRRGEDPPRDVTITRRKIAL
jgi:hypothetical protein